MKKRLLSLFVMMAMFLSLFPVNALAADEETENVVFIQRIAYTGTPEAPCYLLTDENGNATTDGASESNYNIKWDGTNLILKDAYVVGADIVLSEDVEDIEGDAIAINDSLNDICLTLIGNNKLVGIAESSAGFSVYNYVNLNVDGEGTLVCEGNYSGFFFGYGELTINDGKIITSGTGGGHGLSCYGELTINDGKIITTGNGEGQGLSCHGDMYMAGGEITAVGASGVDGSKKLTMSGGKIHATGEADSGMVFDAVAMTDGDLVVSGATYGIGMLENASFTGGTVNIQAEKVGLVVKGDYNLTIGGNAVVNVQGGQTGINIWTPEESFSNCNFIFNSGTLNVSGGEQAISADGEVYAAPAAGSQVVVSAGDDADSVQVLEGSPFAEETIITDLIGESKYVSMSTVGEPIGNPYTDVQEDDWFYDAVVFASKSGLMTGTSATTFEPNTSFSRAMLVSVLHRLEGSPAAEGGTFTDVNEGDWYAEAVDWAAASGIVNGMDDGSFQPNAAVTREQMAAILCNYAQYKGIPTASSGDLSGYSDADQVSEWAENAVAWAVDMGLIHGMSMNTLEPQGATTRAQAATVLMNAGTLLGGF